MSAVLDQLVAMSQAVGDPQLDAAILGEGNTSALEEDGSFWIKASGTCLATMTRDQFVHLDRATVLGLLNEAGVDENRLNAVYQSAKLDVTQSARPSVETVFHALLLGYPGVRFIAHTHPTAVNALTCSLGWPQVLEGRLCPDECVVLGPDSVFIPYIDPGVILARAIRDGVDAYAQRHGAAPKVIYMQNHGLVALGRSDRECVNITHMAIKSARMRRGALGAGGLKPLSQTVVGGLLGRPDEQYRQRLLDGR